MTYASKELVEKMDAIREERGISKKYIYENLEIRASTFYEKMKSGSFYLEEFLAVCRLLEIQPEELLGSDSSEKKLHVITEPTGAAKTSEAIMKVVQDENANLKKEVLFLRTQIEQLTKILQSSITKEPQS